MSNTLPLSVTVEPLVNWPDMPPVAVRMVNESTGLDGGGRSAGEGGIGQRHAAVAASSELSTPATGTPALVWSNFTLRAVPLAKLSVPLLRIPMAEPSPGATVLAAVSVMAPTVPAPSVYRRPMCTADTAVHLQGA